MISMVGERGNDRNDKIYTSPVYLLKFIRVEDQVINFTSFGSRPSFWKLRLRIQHLINISLWKFWIISKKKNQHDFFQTTLSSNVFKCLLDSDSVKNFQIRIQLSKNHRIQLDPQPCDMDTYIFQRYLINRVAATWVLPSRRPCSGPSFTPGMSRALTWRSTKPGMNSDPGEVLKAELAVDQ